MSQNIICTECEYENPPGSKFCSNCGTKLPLGTHIICSNCGTSNTIDRIFCDHCGTRLLPDEPPTEEEIEEKAPPAGGKAFTLPTRKPGETGDLDPRNVPDWLKTGNTRKDEELEDLADEELPRVEELTQKEQVDDLPDWLVSEADSDPIIHAPTVISTEFYKDLLERVDDAPKTDDLFPDESENNNLPDWLKSAGTEPLGSADAEESPKGLTEFLSEMPGDAEDEEEPAKTKPDTDSLTGWLADLPEESDAGDDADMPGLTEWLADEDDEEDMDEAPDDQTDSLTSWLSDESESVSDFDDEEDESEKDSLTSWLADEPTADSDARPEKPGSGSLTEWLSEVPDESEADFEEQQADISDSLTGWLSELPDEDELDTAVDDQKPDESLTDWFSEVPDEPIVQDEADSDIAESLTGWLSELPDEDEIEEISEASGQSEELTDLFSDDDLEFDEFESDADELESAEDADFSSRLTDWLAEGEDVASLADGDFDDESDSEESLDLDSADWFTDAEDTEFDDQLIEEGDSEEPLSSRLTDWLPEAAADEETAADEEEEVEAPPSRIEAEKLSAWISGDSDKEEPTEEEQFDWLEEPEVPVTASGKHEIPSEIAWLEETEEELSNIFQSQPTIEEELPDWLAGVADDGDSFVSEADGTDDDLEDVFRAEQIAAETEIDFLQQTGSLRMDSDLANSLGLDDDEPDLDDLSDVIRSDEPDWLADLAQMGTDELNLPSEMDLETAVEDTSDTIEDIDLDRLAALANEPEEVSLSVESETDMEESDDSFADELEDGELPDWIMKLDATSELPDVEDSEMIPSDEMPEWVANLKPGQMTQDSVLPGALADDLPDTLAGIPEELAGSDLPDWLQDAPQDASDIVPPIPMPADTQMSDIPDWLQSGLEQKADDSDIFSSEGGLLDPTPVSDEWGAILNDLPPAVPIEETLSKAEIPEWVMDLKPVELTGDAPKSAVPVVEGEEETYGALKGLYGVVAVEPIIAQPRAAAPPTSFAVSPEQQQQVVLLRQLAQNGHEQQKGKTRQAGRGISVWTRPLFALILILVMVLGLQGVVPMSLPTTVPAPVAGMNTAVMDAAGETVLVAFEYSPAMAGELTPEAETLLAQLGENESTILAMSQFASGVPIAESVIKTTDVAAVNLGYLPGGSVGLRRLGECLNESVNCEALFSQPLTAAQQAELENVELIIVLTANRENLVGWIEQVGTPAEMPMAAGVTQSLFPVASPFFDTQQLSGVLNGIPGTAVYQDQFFKSDQATDVEPLFQAQVTAEMLLFVVLLLGAIIYLISGYVGQRRQK